MTECDDAVVMLMAAFTFDADAEGCYENYRGDVHHAQTCSSSHTSSSAASVSYHPTFIHLDSASQLATSPLAPPNLLVHLPHTSKHCNLSSTALLPCFIITLSIALASMPVILRSSSPVHTPGLSLGMPRPASNSA
jgi:hypothetical protein